MSPASFHSLWHESPIRSTLITLLPPSDLASVRATSPTLSNILTRPLFVRTHVNFSSATFTRPSRIQGLARIGHHVEHLTFNFPHSDATFLPPLVHPESGREITFLYTPHTSMGSVLARPKYANNVLGDILTAQYPPLFHAATNVPSFINALQHIPNLRHLTICSPGQDPRERYRRDIVDYALISLRVAIERSPLSRLSKLTLSSLHPGAFQHLRPMFSLGCRPSASKRWKQIRKLHVSVESWDFWGGSPGKDHLSILADYLGHFSGTVEKLTFGWVGAKGPCPLALAEDPLFAPQPKGGKKLFNEVTSPMSPLPPAPTGRKPLFFPRLRYVQVRNSTMNASQISGLVEKHRETVREFDFENVVLTRGTWEDALCPLTEKTVEERKKGERRERDGRKRDGRKREGGKGGLTSKSEIWTTAKNGAVSPPPMPPMPSMPSMPALPRGLNLRSPGGSFGSVPSPGGGSLRTAASASEGNLSLPSAAVEAASRELLDEELERSLLGLVGVAGQERRDEILEWAAKTPIPGLDDEGIFDDFHGEHPDVVDEGDEYLEREDSGISGLAPPAEIVEDFTHLREEMEWDGDLISEMPAMEVADGAEPEGTSMKIKKRKIRKRVRRRRHHDQGRGSEVEEKSARERRREQRQKEHKKEASPSSSRSPPRNTGYSSSSTPTSSPRKDSRRERSERHTPEREGAISRLRHHNTHSLSHSHSHHRTNSISPVPEEDELYNQSAIPEVIDDDLVVEDRLSTVLPPLPLLVRSSTTASSSSNKSSKSARSFRSFRSFKSLRSKQSISEEEGGDEYYYGPPTPRMDISAPVLAMEEEPAILLLQPTVYDPAATSIVKQRDSCHDITAVQRNIEAEEQQRMLAEDESMRTSALQKAKEAVLMKLSREFSFSAQQEVEARIEGGKRSQQEQHERQHQEQERQRHRYPMAGREEKPVGLRRKLMDYTFGQGGGSGAIPAPLRAGGDVGVPARNWWGAKSVMSVASECRTLDSQSALVPLIIARS